MTQPLHIVPDSKYRRRSAPPVAYSRFGLQPPTADKCDMFTVEEYYPEPGKLRYLVKRNGLILFGLWPDELADLRLALQSLYGIDALPEHRSLGSEEKRDSASD